MVQGPPAGTIRDAPGADELEDRAGRWRRAAAFHGLVAAVLAIVVWQSGLHLEPGEAGLTAHPQPGVAEDVLGPWLYWDAGAFLDIAQHGYRAEDKLVYDAGGESRIAFFPGYPAMARAVGELTGDVPVAMILITFLSGLGAVLLFDRWLHAHVARGAAPYGLLALLLFPWAFFLVGTGYSDALFLLTSLGAFVLMEEDRPLAAMASGFVATLTRPVGGAITVGLVVIAWHRRRRARGHESDAGIGARAQPRRLALAAAAGSIGGLLCFMAFCWSRYGHPLAFSVAQRGWNQAFGPHTWFKLTFIDLVRHHHDPWFVLRLAIQGVVALLFAASIPAVWKRFGAAYGAYTLIVVIVPLVGSAAFASQGRYMLAAFPTFALLGEHLHGWTTTRRITFLSASAACLILSASFWARGYWMG